MPGVKIRSSCFIVILIDGCSRLPARYHSPLNAAQSSANDVVIQNDTPITDAKQQTEVSFQTIALFFSPALSVDKKAVLFFFFRVFFNKRQQEFFVPVSRTTLTN